MKARNHGPLIVAIMGVVLGVFILLTVINPMMNKPQQVYPTTTQGVGMQTLVAQWTVTPFSGGSGQGATQQAMTDVWSIYDMPGIIAALESKMVESPVDLHLVTSLSTSGGYTYCDAPYEVRRADNPSLSAVERWQDNTILIYDNGAYCVAGVAIGEIYAGVLNPPVINVEIAEGAPVVEGYQEVHAVDVTITLIAPFGMLGPVIASGNEYAQPLLQQPGPIDMAVLNEIADLNDGHEIDVARIHTLAIDGAKMDLVAPFNLLEGTRSSVHLDAMYEALVRNFTMSGTTQANAYDNTKSTLCGIVQSMVSTDVPTSVEIIKSCTLVVNLVWPDEAGVWYQLDSLSGDEHIPVIFERDEGLLRDNLYLVLSNQVQAIEGKNPHPWYDPSPDNWEIEFRLVP